MVPPLHYEGDPRAELPGQGGVCAGPWGPRASGPVLGAWARQTPLTREIRGPRSRRAPGISGRGPAPGAAGAGTAARLGGPGPNTEHRCTIRGKIPRETGRWGATRDEWPLAPPSWRAGRGRTWPPVGTGPRPGVGLGGRGRSAEAPRRGPWFLAAPPQACWRRRPGWRRAGARGREPGGVQVVRRQRQDAAPRA